MALLLNLLASKLVRDCVSRLVHVRRLGGAGSRGVELGLLMSVTLGVKHNRKKKKVSAKFKSRRRQILLGNSLATCTILNYFFRF